MKTILRSFMAFMLMLITSMIVVCCSDDNPSSEEPIANWQNSNNSTDDGEDSKDVAKMILGTWKCNDTDGYTVITFNDNGTSDWKYVLDDDVLRWSALYEITSQYLIISEDGEDTPYSYTLTNTTLSFDGDDYVKVDNYIDEDDSATKNNEADTNYDNRGAVAKQFRGSGTKSNPYIISDATELRKLADDVESGKTYRDEYFKMTADIIVNRSVATSYTGALTVNVSTLEQWKPIGKGLTPFCGTFDGNGHTISGIFIQKPERDSLGLFGYVAGTLTNITLEGSYIEGKNNIGGIVGIAAAATYSKEYAPTISSCISYCVVKGTENSQYQGGIVGYIKKGTVQKCLNYGLIEGYQYVAGVVAKSSGTTILNCANLGRVTGDRHVSGIVGHLAYLKPDGTYIYGELYNCFNFGEITIKDNMGGGIIGATSKNTKASNMVNYGKIVTTSDRASIGALIGYYVGIGSTNKMYNGYYLETSFPIGYGNVKSNKPTNIQSMTSNQMKAQVFLNELNKNANTLGSSYSQWKFGIDGFPIFEWIVE